MSTQQVPNPLRPYYIPPPPAGFGLGADNVSPLSSSLPLQSSSAAASSQGSFNLLPDLQDYTDYLDTPSPNDVLKNFLTQAAVQYGLNLIAQPFENSKTVLQCRVVPKRDVVAAKKKKKAGGEWKKGRDYDSEMEDDDDVGFITGGLWDG